MMKMIMAMVMFLWTMAMMATWEGMKLLAVSTFRPFPRSDTLHLVSGFGSKFWILEA